MNDEQEPRTPTEILRADAWRLYGYAALEVEGAITCVMNGVWYNESRFENASRLVDQALALCAEADRIEAIPQPTLSDKDIADRNRAVSNATHGNYDADWLVPLLEEDGWTIARMKQ